MLFLVGMLCESLCRARLLATRTPRIYPWGRFSKPHTAGIESLGVAARCREPEHIPRHLDRQRTPDSAAVSAREQPLIDDESVQAVGIIRADCKAMNVCSRQVVDERLLGDTTVGTNLEHVVACLIDLATVRAARRQNHRIEVRLVDQR